MADALTQSFTSNARRLAAQGSASDNPETTRKFYERGLRNPDANVGGKGWLSEGAPVAGPPMLSGPQFSRLMSGAAHKERETARLHGEPTWGSGQ